ncbi:Ubiquitin-like modifier-activating enzyme 1 [Histomonas meleagridis]|uniref:Ubiquitin-like modifier-activating enzyme 1 n=1 Tax=Histomonas meleagridis TaxID=135588 RepID=UPI0035599AC6|nr:Ubiquitin-like modifier-activating enzyme 1 [Histomonas meleagridis]KAH0806436.1 Ubiquitin-like modifier-activating enzyme 1 [Histomonas meleagridis]
MSKPTETQIDEDLYSRQIYALGIEAMKRMSNSSVLISGMGGLGVEIAKNVILAGIKNVTIHDTEKTTMEDLASQFYLTEEDIGQNRAMASLSKLIQLNEYVSVSASTVELTNSFLQQFNCVVFTTPMKESQIIEYSNFCHDNNIKFIMTETRGVFGSIFNDFGDNFFVQEPSGQKPTRFLLSGVTNDKEGVVVIGDHEEHGLSNGDHVIFDQVEGMTELNGREFPVKVIDQKSFSIGDTSSFHPYTCENGNGYGNQIILPVTMHFKRYTEAIKSPECINADFTNFGRENQVLLAFTALHRYLDLGKSDIDFDSFIQCAKEVNNEYQIVEIIDTTLLKEFVRENAVISQTSSIFGGIAGQEAIKSVSSKYTPIQMFFEYSNIEALPPLEDIQYIPQNDRYDPYRLIFGNAQQEKIQNLRYFMVGAGAIGCEILKNWALMGLSTGPNGKIYVTDMDQIERSNLNRQFLFRNSNIGQSKSMVAANSVLKMNPSLKIEPQQNRVGPESEDIYTNSFYESLDGICNALDNQQTRLYNDSQCIYYQKPLLESGTLGPMGHFQIIVPFLTKSYGSYIDPPTKGIPECTLHSFPTNINHCTMWAKDTFYGLFTQKPSNINQYIKDKGYVKKMLKSDPGTLLETLESAYKYLVEEKPHNFDDCIKIARIKFEELFNFYYRDLLYQNPPDKVENGQPFWTGSRRIPEIQKYDANNEFHVDFIKSAAFLYAKIYNINEIDFNNINIKANEVEVPEWKPSKNIINTNENDDDTKKKRVNSNKAFLSKVQSLCKKLTDVRNNDSLLNVQEFEKDDNTNGHIDFISAAANLRAISYRIPTSNKLEIKGIAGNIIPALATTTSMICGFVTLEMLKVHNISKKNLEDFKDGFINISTASFQFIQPMKCDMKYIKEIDYHFSMWDKWIIEGDLTVGEFNERFVEKYKLRPMIIMIGTTIVYANNNFLLSKERQEEYANRKITDVYVKEAGMKLPEEKGMIQVGVIMESDENRRNVETPTIYLKFK